MQALRIYKTDDGTQARLEQMDQNDLSEGNVLIRVRYSSVNYKDALAVTGKGKILWRHPLNGGIDAAGAVEQSEDDRFAPGDEVVVTGYHLSENRDGGYAEYLRVPAECVVPLPAGLSLYESMAIGTAGFTAGFALRRLGDNHLRPDMGPIAVTGATGGVGSYAIDMLSKAGFDVTAVTRKADRAGDYLKSLGASRVIDPEEILEGGRKPLGTIHYGGGVDSVGGPLLAALAPQVRQYGSIAAVGLAGGFKLETTVMPFILRGVNLLGIHSVECPMPWRQQIWEDLAGRHKPDHLDSIATQTVGLKDLPDVCESIVAGDIVGRTVVDIDKA
ncbi:MAG: oxidoreductase [Salinisphaeraceae bacterium]|nr:oxidoreductase [Salinisphaeraceae bacterium]